MPILFYEQAVCKRGTKTEKSYLRLMDNKLMDIGQAGDMSLLFKEQM